MDRTGSLFVSSCEITPSSDPNPTWVEFDAIWDTGANVVAVSKNVISACGLRPETDKVRIAHGAGTSLGELAFLVSLRLPNGVEFSDILAVEKRSDDIDVLIGTTVICQGDLLILNAGQKPEAVFRYPPVDDGGSGLVNP